MKRTTMIRRAGPFGVFSLANGDLRVVCEWPKDRIITSDDMVGPGLLSRCDLAQEVEDLLNAVVVRAREVR
jgi:hypothetical protein